MSNFRGMDFHGFVVKVKIDILIDRKDAVNSVDTVLPLRLLIGRKTGPRPETSREWVWTWTKDWKKYQMGKNLKYLHVEGWNRFVLVLAAMPSFQLEDVRCRLSSSSKIVGLLPGYCAVAWKTVWSLSQNLYCWVSQIITPQVTLHRIPLENVREKRGWI